MNHDSPMQAGFHGVSSPNVVLSAEKICKSYPGVDALKDVSIDVLAGEVLGLVGENGAGKSSLVKVLNGVVRPDTGRILLRSKEYSPADTSSAWKQGIALVHQESSLLLNLSVAENMYLGREKPYTKLGAIRWAQIYEKSEHWLSKVGSSGIEPRTPLHRLSFSQRQMVEIARAISIEEEVNEKTIIILDEPTTAFLEEDINRLFSVIERVSSNGNSVIFISHRLEEVLKITDRVFVLKDGKNVACLKTKETDKECLQKLMIGKEKMQDIYHISLQSHYSDAVLLKVAHLSRAPYFKDVNLELHKGEILGMAGVVASGREELAQALFGMIRTDYGEISMDGKKIQIKDPGDAIRHGIGYIPEERAEEGLVLYFNVSNNVTLASLKHHSKAGLMRFAAEKKTSDRWIHELRIKVPNRKTPCINLSGGNQQKVIIGKWLETHPRCLIMNNPTRGIDVGAKEEIYGLMRGLAGKGISIVFLSGSLEEVISLSNRIVVMKDGSVVNLIDSPVDGKPIPDSIMKFMM